DAPRPIASVLTAKEVRRQRRNGSAPLVAADVEPRRDVAILANRRAAARAAIVVRRTELTERAANARRPVVGPREVHVAVVCRFLRQAIGRPVLPPVVVPLEALIEAAHVPIEVTDPRAP